MAAVEFALIAPLLVLILVAVVEIGLAVRQQMQVQDAASAGARYAAQNGWNATAITAAVTSAKPDAGIAASPAPVRFCGCPSATGVAAATCGDFCADGSSARSYVQVSASVARSSILPSSLPLPDTMVDTVTTRIP